jgi:hypothetical protein
MKEYNRTTKRWEEKDESKTGSLKKKKLCRGGKEHDYQICLPDFLDKNQNLQLNIIQEYYNSQDRVLKFLSKEQELLVNLGIERRYTHSVDRIYRYYKCSVCGKKEYDIRK